jgi:hypothetical protein
MATEGYISRGKVGRREDAHSPQSSSEVKNGGSTLPFPICLHGILHSYCHIVWSDYRRGFGLAIGFVDHLQVVTTNNYNTIAISTLYKITLSFPTRSVITSSCLVTDSNNG